MRDASISGDSANGAVSTRAIGRRLANVLARRDGTMTVETAFVLPVFCLLLFGFFEFSFALAGYMNCVYAAQIGARYAAMHSQSSATPATPAQITAVVQQNLFLPGSNNYTVIPVYGNRTNPISKNYGNYQGDLVGVGILWYPNINIPFWPRSGTSYWATAQAYRIITR